MSKKRVVRRFLFLALLLTSISVFSAEIFIYRHSLNQEELTLHDVRNIIEANKLVWFDGKTILLVMPQIQKLDDRIFESLFAINKTQFLTLWRVKFFSGRARMPIQVKSEEQAVELVKGNAGALYFTFKPLSNADHSKDLRLNRYAF